MLCSFVTPGWNQAQDQLCSLLVEGAPLETVHSQCVGPEVSTLGCASLPVTSLLPLLCSSKCRQEGCPVPRMAGLLRQRGSVLEKTWQHSQFTSAEVTHSPRTISWVCYYNRPNWQREPYGLTCTCLGLGRNGVGSFLNSAAVFLET